MSIFDNLGSLRKSGGRILSGVEATTKVAETLNQTRHAFSGMDEEELPYGSMMGKNQGARGRASNLPNDFDEDDDFPEDTRYSTYNEPIIVTEALRNTFRKKAELKVGIIAGRIKEQFILKKLAAKLFIQNTGDAEIANKYRDFTPDQIKELDRPTQKVIRNQKHIQSIDAIELSQELKDQCVEYFLIEFEDEYVNTNGQMPDFSGFNPMELMFQKFNEPFKELLGDLALDLGLELKPKATQYLDLVLNKFVKKKAEEITGESVDEAPEEPIVQEQPSAVVVEESVLTDVPIPDEMKEVLKLPSAINQRKWASTYLKDQQMPEYETPNYQDFLTSKGLDFDDVTFNDDSMFPQLNDRLKFLQEFDKWNGFRANENLMNEVHEKMNNVGQDSSDEDFGDKSSDEEHEED